MAIYGLSGQVKIEGGSLLISEWNHIFDPKTIPLNALADKVLWDKAELSLAINALRLLQTELALQGLYPLSVSKVPAEEISGEFKHTSPGETWSPNIVSRPVSSEKEHPVSIIFLLKKGVSFHPEVTEEILHNSFRIIRAGKTDIAVHLERDQERC